MYVYVRTFLNSMRVLVFCDKKVLRNRRISSMRAVEVASSRLLFVSPASQANTSGTMPVASTRRLSTLSWRGRKTGKIGIHLTENGSNQRHVIFDGR